MAVREKGPVAYQPLEPAFSVERRPALEIVTAHLVEHDEHDQLRRSRGFAGIDFHLDRPQQERQGGHDQREEGKQQPRASQAVHAIVSRTRID